MKTKKIEKIVEKICSGQSVRWTAVKPRASQCAAVMASSTPTGVLDSFFWTQAFIFPIIKFITNHVLIPLNFPPRPGLNSPPTHTHSPITRCLVPMTICTMFFFLLSQSPGYGDQYRDPNINDRDHLAGQVRDVPF